MTGHDKAVLALSVEPAGGRIVSGGHDKKMRIWDFGGMDSRHRAFREVEAQSGYPLFALSFSVSGDRFLAATSSVQPAIFDRDGAELLRFIRGDMYLTDSAHTKGHTHPVTGGHWHPTEHGVILTCASDGTLRTWNLDGATGLEGRLICDQIYKVKTQRGARCHATSCAFDPDGDCLVGGAQEGSVHLWNDRNGKGTNSRPDLVIRSAHPGTDVTSVEFSPSGRQLACRGDDDRVTLWDIRKYKEPLRTFTGLESFFNTSNVTFSPDGRFVCAGTSVRKGKGTGMLKFFDISSSANSSPSFSSSLPEPATLQVDLLPGASVVRVLWHPKLQQVLCSTSAGTLRLLYDPLLSKNGALLTAGRVPRRVNASDFMCVDSTAVDEGSIINPNALPMYRDERFKKRRRGDEKRPGELRKPDFPTNGPARGLEKVSAARKAFTHTYLEGRIARSNLKDQDSRAELIKYNKKSASSMFEGNAYAHNKGVAQLAATTLEQEKEEAEQKEENLQAMGLR
jgi:WD40 repeat protein